MSPRMKTLIHLGVVLAVLPLAEAMSAWAAAPAPAGAPAAGAPPASAPSDAGAGGRRGGGRGGRGGGGLTPEDQAKIAKMDTLPPWKPGVDVGDFVTAPPYSPAPENKVRDEVPKGTLKSILKAADLEAKQ